MAVAPLPPENARARDQGLRDRLIAFFDRQIYPNEARFLDEQVQTTIAGSARRSIES
jgi:hypothetical protein